MSGHQDPDYSEEEETTHSSDEESEGSASGSESEDGNPHPSSTGGASSNSGKKNAEKKVPILKKRKIDNNDNGKKGKRMKKEEKKEKMDKPEDISDKLGENDDSDNKKNNKRQLQLFNDKNLDFNLFESDPSNVISKKIKVSNNVIVTCKMLDAAETKQGGGLLYDYAALTFQRKTKNGAMFEFSLPLNVTPTLIDALKIIIEANTKFFTKR